MKEERAQRIACVQGSGLQEAHIISDSHFLGQNSVTCKENRDWSPAVEDTAAVHGQPVSVTIVSSFPLYPLHSFAICLFYVYRVKLGRVAQVLKI